jgi:FkbM family methyltransferase
MTGDTTIRSVSLLLCGALIFWAGGAARGACGAAPIAAAPPAAPHLRAHDALAVAAAAAAPPPPPPPPRAAGPAAPCAASRARLDFASSSCPSSDFFTELYNADFACKPAVLVDVGANKGYVVAEMLAIFAPALGVAPPALGAAIAASGAAFNEVTGCGICDDCKHTPPPSSAARCAAQARVVVHAFEPVPDNVDMLNLRLGPLLRAAPGAGAAAAAAAAAVSLHVHAAAVVEDASATPSVVVSNCRGGGEGCGVLGAGAAEGADAVRVPAVSLDAWAAGAGVASIDLLFIDAEGADPLVLRGAAALLGAGRVRALVFEYNAHGRWKSESLGDVVAWLDDNANGGFDCFLIQQSVAVLLTRCWDAALEARFWSNVLCVRRAESKLHAAMMRFVPQ